MRSNGCTRHSVNKKGIFLPELNGYVLFSGHILPELDTHLAIESIPFFKEAS